MSLTEYMSKMKSLVDTLHFIGCKLSQTNQIGHYLGGLGQEFEAVTVNVTSKIIQILKDFPALLLSQESRLN